MIAVAHEICPDFTPHGDRYSGDRSNFKHNAATWRNAIMATPVFSVIIPVYGKWDLTRACLASLCEHSRDQTYEVIVVDNASTDATVTELVPLGRNLFGEAFCAIRFTENRNFGPACNAGAAKALAPLLFFLNNDTLMTPDWAPPLLAALKENASLGAVGPLLLYENNTVQHLGACLYPGGLSHLYQNFPADHPVVFRPRRLQFISAAALMLPRDLFFQAGCFYEEYRNGYEDVELSVRIRQAGKELRCVPSSVVCHLESQSPGRNDDEKHNGELLYERCGKDIYIDIHHHGMRDGFKVFVNDLFSLSLRLTDEAEKSLTRQAEGKELPEWLEIMRRHPFWITGRDTLAAEFESKGKFKEALQLRAELADFLPLRERYIQLLRTAARAGDANLAEAARTRLECMTYRRDRKIAAAFVRKAKEWAKDGGDPVLSQLYDEKFNQLTN